MRSMKRTFICTTAASAFVTASAMAQVCGDPAAGDCCVANGTPACSDADCCNLICAQDPLCCDTQWDKICANAAAAQCTVCSGGGGGCDKAQIAVEGLNSFDTSAETEIVDLAGFCDPGPFGDDSLYNVQYFKFTPTTSGLYSVSTCKLAFFDTRLAVMEGCSPADGVLACNDDGNGIGCKNISSLIEAVELESGVEYVILVGGSSAVDSGPGQFEIAPFVGCDLATATQNEVELCGEDLNGGCNSPFVASESISVGATVLGTFWAEGNTRDTDWYLLDLTEATEVTLSIRSNLGCFAALVNTGCSSGIGGITEGECPEMRSVCLPPGQYYIVALTDVFTGYPCGGPLGNEYSLEVTGIPCEAAAPENDNCANATVAVEGSSFFNNTFASTQVADVSCGFLGAPFTKDVWFSFTATQDGVYEVETCYGTGQFNTGIEIWDNCPDLGGSIQACNDDVPFCPTLGSRINYGMTTGQSVLVRVGGWQGAVGGAYLTISLVGCGAPATGDCCFANNTPFCEDAECCTLICAADAFCCDVRWDQLCADAALAQCASCSAPCPADLDSDGQVGAADLAALLNAWGTAGGDLNGNGTTDSADLAVLLNAFGPCP